MKRLFFLLCLSISIFGLTPVFAQTATNGTSTPVISIDYRYNALLEFFLQKLQEKDYQTAYSYMAGNFPKLYTIDDFIHIVTQAGLTTFTEKKWTDFKDQIKDIGVTTATGEFKTPDGMVHIITFHIIIQGDSEIKIGLITEQLEIAELAKRFPNNETLAKLIYKDLKKITYLISKRKNKRLYVYLSVPGKKRTTLREVGKTTARFRNKKFNIRLPKNVVINLSNDSPFLNEQGLMMINGNYTNAKFSVNFVMAYDYDDWKWKLGGFIFEVGKLTAAR